MHSGTLRILIGTMVILVALSAACATAAPTTTPSVAPPEPTATASPDPFAGVPGIVDPANHGWPRQVEGSNGRMTIPDKPERIVNVSLGHDEITLALVPVSRLVAVGGATKLPAYSNVADLVRDTSQTSTDPEVVLSHSPDVVVTSPYLAAEVVDALVGAGLPVVQTPLQNDPESMVQNILLMGYIYGEEERAVTLATEVRARYDALQEVVGAQPESSRPTVLSASRFAGTVTAAGAASSGHAVIEAAGGRNAAAEAGLEQGFPIVSLESVIAMDPDVIIIPQSIEDGGGEFLQDLLESEVLAEVSAVREGRVYLVESRYFITLSFWNLRGIEELARLLWPDELGDREFPAFSLPE